MLLATADPQWLSTAAAAASIYSIKYGASLVTRSLYFHLGWLEGWHETFWGWLQPPHATPVEPPLLLKSVRWLRRSRKHNVKNALFDTKLITISGL